MKNILFSTANSLLFSEVTRVGIYLVDSSFQGSDTTLTYEELLSLLPSSSLVAYTLKKTEASPSETSANIY